MLGQVQEKIYHTLSSVGGSQYSLSSLLDLSGLKDMKNIIRSLESGEVKRVPD